SRLVGAPPGYVGFEEGGQLTEKIRRRPYAVVLLDEIEKAHGDVYNMLLQIMEEGRLTDSFGRNIDFKNVILIMTSNIGADLLKNQATLGFRKASADASYDGMKKMLNAEIEKHFRPEFLNRLDEIIVFRPLTREDLKTVVEYEMSGVRKRLADRNITLEVLTEANEFLIDQGFNPDFGARPLRRAIEHLVEDQLSEQILRGEIPEGSHVKVSVKDGHLFFEATQAKPKETVATT
ncbi:MAG: AAA family ATPase, partial [Planctomycetes bacterium]|nr:AAA family ATPase [Planctomycetota bacterium]